LEKKSDTTKQKNYTEKLEIHKAQCIVEEENDYKQHYFYTTIDRKQFENPTLVLVHLRCNWTAAYAYIMLPW